MQTFLPYADFARSAAVLDVPRLGKQRVETLQILRALELFDYGWGTHPAVQMWRGHTPALVCYGLTFVAEWTRGGRADTTAEKIAEFAPEVSGRSQEELVADGLMPPWWGDERLHSSHRSALVRKDPNFYRPVFGDDDGDVPYFWPDPPSAPSTLRTGDGSVWVVRPSSPEQFAEFFRRGYVGFGTESGLDVDASSGGDLRVLLKEAGSGRRPGKDLRVLASFVSDLDVGDLVAVPVAGEDHLELGSITGRYEFVRRSNTLTPHRRRVRWQGRIHRSDVEPPALLQNPRALFPVPISTSR
ncbi:MSMEG_6728 family protein [Gordonia rubripertincta]|uniref:MSMEG_6728 family protein n=1 Tax=Gordonia rubripertincta TaxID=36822 RepID=A0ABT4N3F8_GORRU|nr:MSMEG_6728 family protein [Gordonia rubripertincta]MCZ4553757.1 MSMEG_6728 family protein [Gordonia rubripertincta]